MPFGWTGKILRIDLTDGRITIDHPEDPVYHRFIGGRGLAGFFLKDGVTRHWRDPQMPLLLFTGPLVNTASPTSGRMTVMSRSPLTGTVGDSSVGGSLGTEMKKAGYDGVVIIGRSPQWCGLEIDDQSVRLVPTTHLVGMTTDRVSMALSGKGALAVIGPAAENGVRFSSVMVDDHFACGRNGLGLIFAVKRLKYIAIKGNGSTKVHDPAALKKACTDIYRLVDASPILKGHFGISKYGTSALYDLMDTRKMMPTDNFRQSRFKHAATMNAPTMKKRYRSKSAGCRGCHIRCKKRGKNGHSLPEFETLSHFSALVGNTDLDTVVAANRLCNQMGMDTISAAATLACFAEIQQKNLSPDRIMKLLEQIARNQGDGTYLKKGAAAYAADQGYPQAAMTVKNLELPAYDPRGAYGMALAYATSPRGACHLRAYPISHEILRKPVATDRFSFVGKARMIKLSEDLNSVIDSLTACKFIFFAASIEEYASVYTAVTGIDTTGQQLLKTGERIFYNERIMNAANGFDKSDDDLPDRFFEATADHRDETVAPPIERNLFLETRSNYYRIRGLDQKGLPTLEKAAELGLDWQPLPAPSNPDRK